MELSSKLSEKLAMSSYVPVDGLADGDRLALGESEDDGETERLALALGLREAEGLTDGETDELPPPAAVYVA